MKNFLSKLKYIKNTLSLGDVLGVISLFAALLSTLYSLATGAYKIEIGPTTERSIDSLEARTEAINIQLKLIAKQQKELSKSFVKIAEIQNNPEVIDKINIYRVSKSIDSLNKSLKRIENIIIQDPAKALELPLIKKDFENLKERNNIELDRLRTEIDKTNTFLLTTLVVLALGVLTNTLINIGKKDNKKTQTDED